jgi:hypothetical protein
MDICKQYIVFMPFTVHGCDEFQIAGYILPCIDLLNAEQYVFTHCLEFISKFEEHCISNSGSYDKSHYGISN